MDMLSMLRTLGALGVVLGMLAGALWTVRRYDIKLPGRVAASGRKRIELVERLAVDAKRSVALIRRDGCEHLVLIGPDGLAVLETGIEAPPPSDTPTVSPRVETDLAAVKSAFGKLVELPRTLQAAQARFAAVQEAVRGPAHNRRGKAAAHDALHEAALAQAVLSQSAPRNARAAPQTPSAGTAPRCELRSMRKLLIAAAAALALLPLAAHAQAAGGTTINLGGASPDGQLSGRAIQLVLMLTVLSLAPGLLMTVTSFTRMVVALSLLRTGIGSPGVPPNPVIISLALFLSFFVMAPTFEKAWHDGVDPYTKGAITEQVAFERTAEPFRKFMLSQVRESDLKMFADLAGKQIASRDQTPLGTLAPAFMISELRRAFEIGFLLLLPFLVIDLAVAAVLMAMGMMMLPPPTISLPMKIIFFVLVDGWALVAGSLVKSFATG